MKEERYVAAIEISSSKIVGTIGRTRGGGELDVLAVEQEKGVESVRYGVIKNLEETSMRIARIVDRLQNRPGIAPRIISGFFVGLSGRSLRSITAEASINLPEETEINDEILDRLKKEALTKGIDVSLEVIDAIPRVFKVGHTLTTSPKGTIGNSIEAVYDLIVCRPELKRNLVRTLPDKLDIEINGVIVTALACGHLYLTSEEKRLGCMLVDMGAETTTVSIYKDGHLSYFATLPLGGRNISRDLTTLSLLEERAEEIKITSGNAIAPETPSNLNLNGVRLSDVSNLIVARAEEIVINIVEQISLAEMKEKDLPGGIVIIGGAANLNGMIDLLSETSGLSVRRGKLPSYIRLEDSRASSADALEVISVLYAGATKSDISSLKMPQAAPVPETGIPNDPEIESGRDRDTEEKKKKSKQRKFLNILSDKMSRLFSAPDDDESDLIDE